MKDYINKDLEKTFTPSEIGTIKKFVAFVADSNQSEQTDFNVAETDDEIKAEVISWLEKRYRQGARANGYKPKNQ